MEEDGFTGTGNQLVFTLFQHIPVHIRQSVHKLGGLFLGHHDGLVHLRALDDALAHSARIALSERGRELATLRVLGFSRGEISYILLGEAAGLAPARFEARTEYGRAEEVIVSAADALDPDLIVIGSRGAGRRLESAAGGVCGRRRPCLSA